MQDNDAALRHRMEELADRSETRDTLVYSNFLNLYEQSVAQTLRLPVPLLLWGGFPGAERRAAVFGAQTAEEAAAHAPFQLLCIAPAAQKFTDTLSHRDFLGSILALGLRREMLGDIVLSDNCGYVFCLDSVAAFISDGLTKVRHTTVRCTRVSALPENLAAEPEPQSLVVASERLDALLAAVFRLSRAEAQKLIAGERVFLDGRLCTRAEQSPKAGVLVSARGFGRFRYDGQNRETKKAGCALPCGSTVEFDIQRRS